LKHLLDIAPQSAIGYAKLGRLRTEQKRWAEAEDAYRKALLREPNSLDALEGLVDLDFRRDRAPNAIRLIRTQLERTPDNSHLYSLLGQALLRNGKPAEAEQALTRATVLDTHNVGALVLLGQTQASRGATDLAISNYQYAIKLVPNSVKLYVGLGGLYELQHDWHNAETSYQKALSIQSDDAFAANNLAYLMLEHGGDVNVALTLAQTARRGLQGMPNSADTLGWAYYQNGSFSAAAPLLEEAVRKDPSNSTYIYHLGLIYAKLKDHLRARAQFERAISIDPKSPIAERARSALSQVAGL
jgi:Flp pilus assembly protein TadD